MESSKCVLEIQRSANAYCGLVLIIGVDIFLVHLSQENHSQHVIKKYSIRNQSQNNTCTYNYATQILSFAPENWNKVTEKLDDTWILSNTLDRQKSLIRHIL